MSGNAVFNIKDYGAKGNGKTINTKYINDAISACNLAGGGMVLVPKGLYITGTIIMQSNVHLYLESGAIIKGTDNLSEYKAYIPTKDMHKYGMAYFPNWTRGLIVATKASNMSISGSGIIDGSHVEDPKGEEGKRGPHGIVFGECSNFQITGISITRASNYAFVGYENENAYFSNLTMTEGWDGIHIRGGKNVIIHDCTFYTGDDAIAGGFWNNVSISNCFINTACNGIRVIFPASNLEIANCTFQGPGKFPQRSTFSGQRRNMLGAVVVQPGGWDYSPGHCDNINIHDLTIDSMNSAVSIFLNKGNSAGSVIVERIKATNIVLAAYSAESWNGGYFENVIFKDITTTFKGDANKNLRNLRLENTSIESRKMPYWGFYGKNIKNLTLENIDFSYTDAEVRSTFGFENIEKINMKNIKTKAVADVKRDVLIQCGNIISE